MLGYGDTIAMASNIKFESQGPVAVITIDRYEHRNAIDHETGDELYETLQQFDSDDDLAVGVITGSRDTFSAGADIRMLTEGVTLEGREMGYMGFSHATIRKPLIAAIEGYCIAGGLELALFCDIRIAAENAVFGFFQRRYGIPLTDGGTQRLPHIIGLGRALEMLHTGREVEAEEAYDWGLANKVVDDGNALSVAIDMARGIASFPQQTVQTDRKAMYEGLGEPIDKGFAIESWGGSHSMQTGREGARRFIAGEGRHGEDVFGESDRNS